MGSNYPPGVSGNEPEITGQRPDDEPVFIHARWPADDGRAFALVCGATGGINRMASTDFVAFAKGHFLDGERPCVECSNTVRELRRYVVARRNGMHEPLGIGQFVNVDDLPF